MTDGMLAALIIAIGASTVALLVLYAARRSHEAPPAAPAGLLGKAPAPQTRARRGPWLLPVLVLSLPAVVATLVDLFSDLLRRHDVRLPEPLEDALRWAWVLAGMLGFFFSPGALIVALVGSCRSRVSARTRLAMWGFVVPSLLALFYLALRFRP